MMIYLFAPFILIFDSTTFYFGKKVVSRVQTSATSDVSYWTVIHASLRLLLLRVVSLFIPIDSKTLKLYKINKPLITRVGLAILLNVAWFVGLVWASVETYIHLDDYTSGAHDGLIFVTTILSALATLFSFLLYHLTKESISKHRSKFWLNFDNINTAEYSYTAASAGASAGGSDRPRMGTHMKKVTEEDAIYWSLEFFDDRKAAHALHIYRTDRHGQYQYLGLPEPKTIVVHKQDVTGLIERLRDEGYLPDSDFVLNPVFLAGQLSPAERINLRRRGSHPSTRLKSQEEFKRQAEDAEKRLAIMRPK
jgi:hypothetical protein